MHGRGWTWRRVAALILGVAVTLLGAYIIVRPFASLGTLVVLIGAAFIATGLADVMATQSVSSRWDAWVGLAWIAGGIAVLAWAGITIRALAIVVGIGLIVSGLAKARVVFGPDSWDARTSAGIFGLANIVFGLLALAWPDVTLLVIALVFGARTIWFGLTHVSAALVPTSTAGSEAVDQVKRPGVLRRFGRLTGAVAALVVALALTGVSVQLHRGTPTVDAFYTAPRDVPSQPGQLLRSEPVTTDIPAGASAWRILYTTTKDDHADALASAIVVVPDTPGVHPVIAWAHGTTGYEPPCAPSLATDPFGSGAFYLLPNVIEQGWALVATDYTGLGTEGPQPYLIGQGEGRSVLDAVRAATQLKPGSLSDQTVVWGHSQGGNAALWTGILAPSYAPDDHVIGVAALAPASDLPSLLRNLPQITGGSIFASYAVEAYSQTYPDVSFSSYVRPGAQTVVKELSKRCLAEPGVLVSVLTALSLKKADVFAKDPTTGPLGERLSQNIPTGRIQAPLLIAQGLSDQLVLPAVQRAYVQSRCAAGQALEYQTYPGLDHVPLVQANSPLVPNLITWTQQRLAGQAAPSNCDALP